MNHRELKKCVVLLKTLRRTEEKSLKFSLADGTVNDVVIAASIADKNDRIWS